jgi:hypothetical protein
MKLIPEASPVLRLLLFSCLPLLIGGWILARLAPDFILGVAHCPLRDMTGFPCPTCGGTLTATHLTQGHWVAAVQVNPLVVLGAVVYLLAAVHATAATLVPAWRRSLQLSPPEKRTARLMAVLLLILNWAWLIRVYLF